MTENTEATEEDLAAEVAREKARAEKLAKENQRELDQLSKRLGRSRSPKYDPAKGIINQEVELLNERHFIADDGRVYGICSNEQLICYSASDFGTLYAGFSHAGLTPAGKNTMIPLSKIWKSRPNHRQHSRVIFDPTGKRDPRAYNLWRGFGVEPKAGKWDLMQHHIREHVCGGVQEYYDYLLGWMALAVQRLGDRPGVAVVLRGGLGVRKNTLAEIAFRRIFGSHFFMADSPGQHTGRFNGHLQNKIFVFANEGFWAGDKAAEGRLKALITDGFRAIERKGVDITHDENLTRLIIASNEGWVIPAGMDERRFFVLEVKVPWENGTPEHEEFFDALYAEIDAGGIEAMLHDLLAMDLSGFKVRNVPQTEALQKQKTLSLEPVAAWWFDVLYAGHLPGASNVSGGWGSTRLTLLHEHYERHVQGHKLSQKQLTVKLKELLPRPYEVDGKRTEGRYYVFPPLDECRAFWEKKVRGKVDWSEHRDYEKFNLKLVSAAV